MAELRKLMQERKSVYKIGRQTEVSPDQVAERLEEVVTDIPSAFNSQSPRLVLISGEKHEKVWDLIDASQKEALRPDSYASMATRFADAKKGLGTVLLFESKEAVEAMPTNEIRANQYKENNHGIAAYAVWLILTELGLGATLQHHNIGYDEGYDKEIRDYLGLPDNWEMLAQMPFGSIESPGANKPKLAVDERLLHLK